MIEERRKYKRYTAPKVSLAVHTDIGPLFGRIHDISHESVCATLDATPEGNPVDLILRMFKKDLKFTANVIRSTREGERVYVAMLFDWNNSPIENRSYLDKFFNEEVTMHGDKGV